MHTDIIDRDVRISRSVRKKEIMNWDYCPKVKGPSFSSTLLEQIYRSIDAADTDGSDHGSGRRKLHDDDDAPQIRPKLEADKWTVEQKKGNGNVMTFEDDDINKSSRSGRPVVAATVQSKRTVEPLFDSRKLHYIDNDPLFFSSGSNSSDSNSSLFSDHESIPPLPTTKTRSSCFLPPKPIRTREKKKTNQSGAKTEQHHSSETEHDDDFPPSAKSRALKLYSQLKKMKQPISPGVKLTTFINSILSNTKKHSSSTRATASKKPTCSSASSFTRVINSVSVKPSVKLVPVSVKPDVEPLPLKREDALDNKEHHLRLRRQLLHRVSSSKPSSNSNISAGRVSEDAASDCSEDLFELDHLKVGINAGGDLPVFETTRRISSSSNRNRVHLLSPKT